MDSVQAKHLAKELSGKKVGGWLIGDSIDNGKSAVVLHGSKDGKPAAVKIFSPELVEQLGKKTQLERISREKSLIGKHHDNLISILDGGLCPDTGHCFIVMEYLPGNTLTKTLKEIPRAQISRIIGQIASAARFLEDYGLAHRDIKPDNITILKEGSKYKAVLLDLGVLRPTKASSLTNDIFIGTLQYSSPEFLLRKEENTTEGWRAVTFYQLGAVLHDLIMLQPIFADDANPYARLVNAVQHTVPTLACSDVPNHLILLAKNCLLKDPLSRHKSVTWDDFDSTLKKPNDINAIKEKIKKNIISSKATEEKATLKQNKSDESIQYKIQSSADEALAVIKSICITDRDIFPPLENQINKSEDDSTRHIIISFRPSVNHGLLGCLSVCIFISMIDAAESVFKFGFAAKLSSNKPSQDTFCSDKQTTLYTGVFDSNSIREAFKPMLFNIIEKAQEISLVRKEINGATLAEYCDEITFEPDGSSAT